MICLVVPLATAQDRNRREDDRNRREKSERKEASESCENGKCKKEFKYRCNNLEWVPYKLDEAPAEDGVYLGDDSEGNPGFIGCSSVNGEIGTSRIQISCPQGSYQVYFGYEAFINDTKRMWYLKNNCDHQYTWINSSSGKLHPFGLEVFEEKVNGFEMYVGRRNLADGSVAAGIAVPSLGVMYYADEARNQLQVREYEILICKSRVCE